MPDKDAFQQELYEFDPSLEPAWYVLPRTTIAIVTWNRLEYTKKLLASLERYTHLPHRILVVDNASDDGTVEFLGAFAENREDVRLILNSKNLGLPRAHQQIQKAVDGDLLVICDNDVELLSNYWLVHIQKAYHALRLAKESMDVAFGLRLLNCEEYGFLYSSSQSLYRVPSEAGAPPRSSYAAIGKDDPQVDRLHEELVDVMWTEHLVGPINVLPVSLFQRLELKDQYPVLIGGTDSFKSREILRQGGRLGYLKNGPVARHNDWPYSEEKIADYSKIVGRRARSDLHYLRWKLRRWFGKGQS